MLLGDVPGGVTAHHSKRLQYSRVIVDLRPARGESGVAEAFALPSAGGRLGDDFPNLLYVVHARAGSPVHPRGRRRRDEGGHRRGTGRGPGAIGLIGRRRL